ncbi:MAG: hypothetical protein KDC71_12685 [Acidobacteria bacterium]|nr:hypothetical protein [Acidobacteriota bacterium]
MDTTRPDDSGDGSLAQPKKYLSSGIALMSPNGGDTLIVLPGIYSNALDEIDSMVNGQTDAYNRVIAQQDGTVVITTPFLLPVSTQWVQFEGLRWESAFQKGVMGHHIRFFRCGFRGSEANGNRVTFGIGTNDQTPGAHHVLIEDCWFYGLGGRYNLLVFNSEQIVLRRIVARHDSGWDGSAGSNPEAAICIYSSRDVQVQNALCIDNTLNYFYWEATLYLNKNNGTSLPMENVVVQGTLCLHNRGVGIKLDGAGPVTNSIIRDTVVWDGPSAGVATNSGGSGHQVLLDQMLIGQNDRGVSCGGQSGNQIETLNSILVDNPNGAFIQNSGTLTHRYNNCFNNGAQCQATGETGLDPYANGLLFPTRLEADSIFWALGEGGTRMGMNITRQIGISGTLYGEPGFDSVTTEPLWPWPFEQRIASEMCDETQSGVADRGWCLTPQSLTQYVWGTLGNNFPCSSDPDQDGNGQIDVLDGCQIVSQIGSTTASADLNCDGIVSQADLGPFMATW